MFWRAALQVSLVDGVTELLRGIEAAGMPMGVVSNSSFAGPSLEAELEVQGIRRFFRFVISSADYGVRKPDPIIFEVALRRLGMGPGQVWFAGDNVTYDIIGARRAGIFPVAFNPRKAHPGRGRRARRAFVVEPAPPADRRGAGGLRLSGRRAGVYIGERGERMEQTDGPGSSARPA